MDHGATGRRKPFNRKFLSVDCTSLFASGDMQQQQPPSLISQIVRSTAENLSSWTAMNTVRAVVAFLRFWRQMLPGLYLECSGWGCNRRAGGPLPSPHLLFLPLPSLRSRPPKIQLGGLGSAVSSPAGYGAEPQPTNKMVHFSLKI